MSIASCLATQTFPKGRMAVPHTGQSIVFAGIVSLLLSFGRSTYYYTLLLEILHGILFLSENSENVADFGRYFFLCIGIQSNFLLQKPLIRTLGRLKIIGSLLL